MWSGHTVDIPRRFQAKEASHFPVNKSHDHAIVNYAVGLGEVIVHKTHIWVSIGVREDNIVF